MQKHWAILLLALMVASAVPALAADNPAPAQIDNERVTVWDYTPPARRDAPPHRHRLDAVVVWLEGSTPHAAFLPRGTSHASERIGGVTHATIFELK